MANPSNNLDRFTTYTYHFELHVADTWEKLLEIEGRISDKSTSPDSINDTLVINTRKDAHSSIDNVKYTYHSPLTNPNGQLLPSGDCEMSISEPNGSRFVEKLNSILEKYQTKNHSELIWGLKTIFVGRTPDNKIEIIPVERFLPLVFNDSSGLFTHRGAEYNLKFVIAPDIMSAALPNFNALAFCNKNIVVEALTVKEALRDVENKLNDNFENVYSKQFDGGDARRLKYFINVKDGDIDGKLSLVTKNTFAPDEKMKIVCSNNRSIVSWIYDILRSCDDLNKEVALSAKNINQEGMDGVKILGVHPRLLLKSDVAELHYDVMWFKGGLNPDRTYEFDFLFSEPGKNVDVLAFDMRLKSTNVWFSGHSRLSVDNTVNTSGTLPTTDVHNLTNNVLTEDKTKNKLVLEQERLTLDVKRGSILTLPPTPNFEASGLNRLEHTAVANARLMFSSIVDAHSAINTSVVFTIRGHLKMLSEGASYPDGSVYGMGVVEPCWIKVNIHSPDPGHPKFFYTGFYQLLAIENHFIDGKFTQNLSALMVDRDDMPNKQDAKAASELNSILQTDAIAEKRFQSLSPSIRSVGTQSRDRR